uniref:GATA-type domain-containing protein n=1 Tax=Mola mola TaxID=94237 RepID=A0A3Q3W437_MOLML
MINLQCEKLLHHSDVEQSDKASTATAHRMDQEVGGDCVSVEFTFRPSREEYRLKDSEMSCCVQSQAAEDTVEPELVEEKQNALFQTIHAPNASLNNQLTCNSSVNASIPLLKPEQTLDCNANPIFIMHPLNSIVHSSQSVSTVFSIEEGHSLPKHGDGIAAVQLEGTHTPIEQNNPPAEQCKSSSCNVETNPLSSAASKPEPRPVQNEEFAPSATQQRRNKTRRKQPHPSRSVDIQDPDFQGVTFRMDTELDDSREQCRLLITSKYSKELCKNVRKPRQRIRTSQKSLKTSSSDEENDLTGSGKACASCCTRKTPMWRDAEDGTPLCNACGIRYKKYRVRCINCWHIPRKEGNSISRCFKCGNFVRLISAQCKHTA